MLSRAILMLILGALALFACKRTTWGSLMWGAVWPLRTSDVFPRDKPVLLVGNCPSCTPPDVHALIDTFPGTVVRFNGVQEYGKRPADQWFVNRKTRKAGWDDANRVVIWAPWLARNKSTLLAYAKNAWGERDGFHTTGFALADHLVKQGYEVHLVGFAPGTGTLGSRGQDEKAHDFEREARELDAWVREGKVTRH